MSDSLRIALAQLTSIDDIEANLEMIEGLLRQIPPSDEPTLVCFPENCLYMRCKEGEAVQGIELSHKAFSRLANQARNLDLWLHLGALPLREAGVVWNASVLISNTGEVKVSYKKMHLFDIHLENSAPFRESDVFRHGQEPAVFKIGNWSFGQSICYDLRFAELFSVYAQMGVDVLLNPAAFLVKTGQAHWEVLQRARAIESQAYVIASAQCGVHQGRSGGQKETYGHALAIDPWGRVIADLGADAQQSVQLKILRLEKQLIATVRKQIPMAQHRRKELLRT